MRNILVPLAVVALLLWLCTRVGSVVVLARREVPGSPVYFFQEDPAWSGDLLGDSGRTLGKYGDSVVCLASLMQMQGLTLPQGDPPDPGTLNAWLSEAGAYDRDGGLNWSRVGELLNAKARTAKPQSGSAARIEALLQREIYPIVQVNRSDVDRRHDVLVVGSVHGEFLIFDPLDPTDRPNTLGLYGNRIFGMKYLETE
ncbi:MAG: hypothetical protein IJH38_03355 [Clostridia bacterium]|nr:hypothetical protein [Clostridia bacterium]